MTVRNNNIDVLKILLAFLVVALHIFPILKLEGIQDIISYEIANGISRIAVPTFFIISGYFLRNKINDTIYLWQYSKRILLLFIVWQLIYLPDLLQLYYLKRFTTIDVVLKIIFGYWHLWYLLASVLGVLVLYYSRNFSLKTKWFVIIILLLFGYSFQILNQSGIIEANSIVNQCYNWIGTTRNFLFFGYPLLLIGSIYDHWKSRLLPFKFLIFPLFVLLILESFLYHKFEIKALDFLIFVFPISMFLVLVSIESKSITRISFPPTLSLGIYLCHPFAIRAVYVFFPQKELAFVLLKYFLICLVAILCWWIVEKINRKFSWFF
ncbi:acyltransferase [Flavobacterium sp.]|uniref:acyltransferase n=1 Tax=Flavobacterium sp. TaxID=239 RepID=UPI00286D8785|nr:acyltransferase [Flavobacterium sp.]